MKKPRPLYLFAHYYSKPRAGSRTQLAGWASQGNSVQWDEQVSIGRDRSYGVGAKLILDLTAKTVVYDAWNRNRSFDELFQYFFKSYHQYITDIMARLDPVYLSSMLDSMQSAEQARSKPLIDALVQESLSEEITGDWDPKLDLPMGG